MNLLCATLPSAARNCKSAFSHSQVPSHLHAFTEDTNSIREVQTATSLATEFPRLLWKPGTTLRLDLCFQKKLKNQGKAKEAV